MTNSDWIPIDQYQDIMCCAVKRCRDDKGFIEIHKQLERTREHLIRNVRNFDAVIKDVEALVVERRRELEKPTIEDYGPQLWHMGNDGAYIMIRKGGRKTTIRSFKT